MEKQKGISLISIIIIIAVVAIVFGGFLIYEHFMKSQVKSQGTNTPPAQSQQPNQNQQPSTTTQKINPIPATDQTVDWKTSANQAYGFEFKDPADFFAANQEPRILIGACNYGVFPSACPNINDIVIKDEAAGGGDIKAIESNLAAPNYWQNPEGEKLLINNVPYCLYHTADAGMGHVYDYYYYATVKNGKCLLVYLATATANCDFYLPLEAGNTEQQKSYDDCLTKDKNQPLILDQIISTFEFTDQSQTGCNADSDCQNGASCLVTGPLIANQPVHKVCVPKGQAVPL